MSEQTSIKRVESFPFTSSSDGYDADGYPVYDRAVGSDVLRATFREFFTDGVFPSPAGALQISKGDGLAVNIAPGAYIIHGAMGWTGDSGMSLTLDTAAPQGNVAYGIMLRYDENINSVDGMDVGRSLSIRAVKGETSSSPQPPEPESGAGIVEYRLGYATVPSGAVDLTGATVTNEKGLATCPYAAPFEEIDLSQVTADAKASASEALSQLLAYFEQYRDTIDAAIDGTLAGQLTEKIAQLQEQLDNLDLSGLVDNKTIEYASPDELNKKLSVMDGAITKNKLAQELHDAILPPSGTDGDFLVVSSGAPSWAAPKIVWRELWSGEWSIGEITIQDVADYDYLRVSSTSGMDGLEILAFKTSYGFSGATCGYQSSPSDGYVYMYYFVVSVSEDGTVTPKMKAGINSCPARKIVFSQNKVNVSTYNVGKIEGGRLA